MRKITVIKVGGAIVEAPRSLANLLDGFCKIEGDKILVHGGGRTATQIAATMGVETKMVNGRRVTDQQMLQIVTMVYGGLVNKQVVAQLNARGLRALGLTGADLGVIRAHKRPVVEGGVDYGLVGDVDSVDAASLEHLLAGNITPVVAPLTLGEGAQLLNTNADTIASEVAKALAPNNEVTLVYCFEKAGVLRDADDDSSVIAHIDTDSYATLKQQGIVSGGMLPKLDNSFAALHAGVKRVVITRADSLNAGGTTIEL